MAQVQSPIRVPSNNSYCISGLRLLVENRDPLLASKMTFQTTLAVLRESFATYNSPKGGALPRTTMGVIMGDNPQHPYTSRCTRRVNQATFKLSAVGLAAGLD